MEERPRSADQPRPESAESAESAEVAEGDADLLTIGLVVFFVALILTVGALLLAPALF